MSRRKICVPIVNRANYSSIRSALKCIRDDPELELQLLVCASALLPRFGEMHNYIREDGFDIAKKIFMSVEGENPITMAKTTGLGIIELATAFQDLDPDIVVTVGDRFETMSTAIAASYMNIPLAQTMGGEVSGTIDESIRHAITKLAHIHFPANRLAAERIMRMGENPDMVFNVGCPRVDMVLDIMKDPALDFDVFERFKGVGDPLDLSKGYLMVSQHPVTTECEESRYQIRETLEALKELEMPTIMLWPNVDAGSGNISKEIRTFREKNDVNHFLHLFVNLPPDVYTRLMINCSCIIGNSSSAIREGAALGVPTVNIGTRQQGRKRGRNVIDTGNDRNAIRKAIAQQLSHGRYAPDFIYGDGKAGERIARILTTVEPNIQKSLSYSESDLASSHNHSYGHEHATVNNPWQEEFWESSQPGAVPSGFHGRMFG